MALFCHTIFVWCLSRSFLECPAEILRILIAKRVGYFAYQWPNAWRISHTPSRILRLNPKLEYISYFTFFTPFLI